MSDEFTPGPWSINPYPSAGFYGYEIQSITKDAARHICSVGVPIIAVGCANARLIAAAPEMFRLLKALAEDPEVRSESPDECNEAIALIKKVRGEG